MEPTTPKPRPWPRLAVLALLAAGIAANWVLGLILAERGGWVGWIRHTQVGDWVHDVRVLERASIGAVLAMLLLAFFASESPRTPLRRAARYTMPATLVAFVGWFVPFPFAVQRVICFALILIAAGLFAIAAIGIALSKQSERRTMIRDGAIAALGMTAAAAAGMLLIKLHTEGFNQAID